jgi:hypothetical protein
MFQNSEFKSSVLIQLMPSLRGLFSNTVQHKNCSRLLYLTFIFCQHSQIKLYYSSKPAVMNQCIFQICNSNPFCTNPVNALIWKPYLSLLPKDKVCKNVFPNFSV